MKNNFILTLITLCLLVAVIIIPSVIKVNKRHNDRLLLVTYEKIKKGAEDCYYDDVCKSNKITLKELYNNKYLEEIANPITKEYYNENSYVIITDIQTSEFIEEGN